MIVVRIDSNPILVIHRPTDRPEAQLGGVRVPALIGTGPLRRPARGEDNEVSNQQVTVANAGGAWTGRLAAAVGRQATVYLDGEVLFEGVLDRLQLADITTLYLVG